MLNYYDSGLNEAMVYKKHHKNSTVKALPVIILVYQGKTTWPCQTTTTILLVI